MLGENAYTVTRQDPGAYINGEFIESPTAPVTVRGTLQPMTDREMMVLEEGVRRRARYKFYVRFDEAQSVGLTALAGDNGSSGAFKMTLDGEELEFQADTIRSTYRTKSALAHVRYILVQREGV